MDGNRRWAQQRGLSSPTDGHRAGVETTRKLLQGLQSSSIRTLTLFAFSSENHERSRTEVSGLMELFTNAIKSELNFMQEHGVRVHIVGNRKRMGRGLARVIESAERQTQDNRERDLVIAFSYGGRWDITQAAAKLARQVQEGVISSENIDEQMLQSQTQLGQFPDPDLCIRTGGEQRLSNFLLWHLAYTELYFTPTLWPDFTLEEFQQILNWYEERERRYGGGYERTSPSGRQGEKLC